MVSRAASRNLIRRWAMKIATPGFARTARSGVAFYLPPFQVGRISLALLPTTATDLFGYYWLGDARSGSVDQNGPTQEGSGAPESILRFGRGQTQGSPASPRHNGGGYDAGRSRGNPARTLPGSQLSHRGRAPQPLPPNARPCAHRPIGHGCPIGFCNERK